MNIPEGFERSVEKLRLDPAGFASIALGAAAHYYFERRKATEPVPDVVLLASLGLLATGIVHVGNVLEYSQRAEASLRENGFDDTNFLQVRAYCYRQATRVICQKTGDFEKYEGLLKTKEDTLRFRRLPHI